MQTIKSYRDRIDAGIAQGILIDDGINAFVAEESVSTVDPGLVAAGGGVRLMVDEADVEKASQILSELCENSEEGGNSDVVENTNILWEITKFGSKFLLHIFIVSFIIILAVVLFAGND